MTYKADDSTKPFRYSRSIKFTEQEYVELNSVFLRKTKWLLLLFWLVLGLTCLFSIYTAVLGFILLVLLVTCVVIGRRMPSMLLDHVRQQYRDVHLNRISKRYSVDESHLSIDCPLLHQRTPWHAVEWWQKRSDWLRIWAPGGDGYWFQISDLKRRGIYNRVMELCRKYGTEWTKGNKQRDD